MDVVLVPFIDILGVPFFVMILILSSNTGLQNKMRGEGFEPANSFESRS